MTSKGKQAQQQTPLDEQTIRDLKAREARLERLWKMRVGQRINAMRKGELSLEHDRPCGRDRGGALRAAGDRDAEGQVLVV